MSNFFKIIRKFLYGCLVFFILLIGFSMLFTELMLGLFFLILGVTLIPSIKTRINLNIHKFLEMRISDEKQIKATIGIAKFIIFILLFGLIVNSMPAPETTKNDSQTIQQKEQNTKNKYRDNKNARLIAEKTGLDKDSAGKVYETLINCGVGNIESIELFADYSNAEQYEKPSKCYDIKAYDIPSKLVVYIDKNGNVLELYYDMKDIIINGKRVASISDYVLKYDEWLDLRTQAQIYIEKFLLAPKTAKFGKMSYSIDENKIIHVSGNVEAKNLFGVPLDTFYRLEYKKTDSGFSLQKGKLGDQVIN